MIFKKTNSLFILVLICSIALTSCALSPEQIQHRRNKKAVEEYSEDQINSSRFVIGKSYSIMGGQYHPKVNLNYVESGFATWYHSSFHGRVTASGPVYDETSFTAAHKTLPLPSVVRVTNLENGREITVVVNDRGPFHSDKRAIIDLSKSAAEELDMINIGKARVKLQYLHEETKKLHKKLPEKHRKKAVVAFNQAAQNG